MIICFIGPDGSGKTTYANNMFKYMINKGFKASYHELNFGFLPRISAILNIFRIKKKVLKDPEGEFHSGVKHPLIIQLRLFYLHCTGHLIMLF